MMFRSTHIQPRNKLPAVFSLFALLIFFGISFPVLAGGQTNARVSSCNKAADPARCEARIAARKACKDRRGADKKKCMGNYMPPPDCSKAQDPKRCMAETERAAKICKGKDKKACLKAKKRAAKQ